MIARWCCHGVLLVLLPAGAVGQPAAATDPSPHGVEMVTVEGVRIPYLDWGGRGPGLVFVAGLGNSAHVFDDFAPRFTDRFRVIAVTRPGYGEADQPERDGYDLRSRVAHVRAAIDAAGITTAVLAGHSLGGDEITAFAVAHPRRTTALVYLDAAIDHAAALKRLAGITPLLPEPPGITAEERSSVSAFREYFRRTTSLEYPIGEVLALTVPGRRGLLNNRSPSRVGTALMDATVPPEFDRVKAPMLALYAESTTADAFPWLANGTAEYARANAIFADRIRPMLLDERERFTRAAPRARVVAFRAHHYVFLSHPHETERRMRAFLATLAQGARR